jgi:hypothetical protein
LEKEIYGVKKMTTHYSSIEEEEDNLQRRRLDICMEEVEKGHMDSDIMRRKILDYVRDKRVDRVIAPYLARIVRFERAQEKRK